MQARGTPNATHKAKGDCPGLYSEAIAAIKSVILIDERMQSVARKLDRLTDEVRDMKDRLIRLETMIEISRGDGAVLRIARVPGRGSDDPAGKT